MTELESSLLGSAAGAPRRSSGLFGDRLSGLTAGLILLGLAGLWQQWVWPSSDKIADYAAWHSVFETLSIAISILVAANAWFGAADRPALRTIAFGFAAVALLDICHMLSFPGMPDWLGPSSVERGIVFWLAARFALLLAMILLLTPSAWQSALLLMLVAWVGLALTLGIQMPAGLPALYRPGQGLTATKVLFEWGLVTGHVLLALAISRRELPLSRRHLVAGLLILAVGELYFTLYREAGALPNALGHVYKLLGQAFFLRAVILAYVVEPFRRLQDEAQAHQMTAAQLNALIDGAPDGIFLVDSSGRILRSNAAAERLFDTVPGGLQLLQIEQLVPEALRQQHIALRAGYLAQPNVRSMTKMKSLQALRLDGSAFDADISLAPLVWRDQRCTIAFVRDATDRVSHLQRLEWLACHDELSGLPNRNAVLAELQRRLTLGEAGACILFDLSHLARVNDALGHEVGDQMLLAFIDQLKTQCQDGDYLGRIEGDRFLMIVSADHSPAIRIENVHRQLELPVVLGHELHMELVATAGYSRFPADADRADILVQSAEIALDSAKRRGRLRWAAFEPQQRAHGERWMTLAAGLPAALQNGEFRLVYQPRQQLSDARIVGFEALLRWQHGGQAISPADFIPIAEETGFILPLGRWVIEQALAQAHRWQAAGLDFGRLAINLSTRQLADADLPEFLIAILASYQVSAQQLELEVTETAAMENLEWAAPRLAALAEVGVELSLDDFGTGYSSLAYLQSLPVSMLKIDISFVQQLGTPAGDALMQGIASLARSLGKITLAEGVETELQRQWLTQHGIDQVQGWLSGRPLEVEAAIDLLRGLSATAADCG